MKKEILESLKEVEQQHNIKVLYACESGSRAWGFPSVDSDYDVRFIYAHDLKWYLALDKQIDTINTFLPNDLSMQPEIPILLTMPEQKLKADGLKTV